VFCISRHRSKSREGDQGFELSNFQADLDLSAAAGLLTLTGGSRGFTGWGLSLVRTPSGSAALFGYSGGDWQSTSADEFLGHSLTGGFSAPTFQANSVICCWSLGPSRAQACHFELPLGLRGSGSPQADARAAGVLVTAALLLPSLRGVGVFGPGQSRRRRLMSRHPVSEGRVLPLEVLPRAQAPWTRPLPACHWGRAPVRAGRPWPPELPAARLEACWRQAWPPRAVCKFRPPLWRRRAPACFRESCSLGWRAFRADGRCQQLLPNLSPPAPSPR
jgi:hypothetical protein